MYIIYIHTDTSLFLYIYIYIYICIYICIMNMRQVADKTLLVGLSSTVFRGAKYTSHEAPPKTVGVCRE